ncbi:MAG: electron transport complex subunit RsxC [Candidatus Wallbacteria bacterium]|nr:electron transport complex subunit RsxC [Candidatus Wallbacteria bacterium]
MPSFPGGIHPDDCKGQTRDRKIEKIPLPDKLIIPLSQHIGNPAKCKVKVGETVLKGQVIGDADGFVSLPVHASSSGEVTAVENSPHPQGKRSPAIVIKTDGRDQAVKEFGLQRNWEQLSVHELIQFVKEAGIAGLGGAAFPAHVKLSPPPEKKIDLLLINGAECEPFLTADHRLMLEQSEEILQGIRILLTILGLENCLIGIEENKRECYEALVSGIRIKGLSGIKPVLLPVKYPQGSESQLIYSLTGREVPSGGLPLDIGIVVQNVGTAAALFHGVARNIPLISRVVTVTGAAVRKPGNYLVPLGTQISRLLEFCEADLGRTGKVICGGPLMGISQPTLDAPVIKGTCGILLQGSNFSADTEWGNCIRCGRCIRSCPTLLLPVTIAALSRKDRFTECREYGLLDCKECGCCSFVCPAKIPLTHYIKLAKYHLLKEQHQQNKSGA